MAFLRSVSTALPENRIDQRRAIDALREWAQTTGKDRFPFDESKAIEIFENSGVKTRYSIEQVSDLLKPRDFGEKSRRYREAGCKLGRKAVEKIFREEDIDAGDIDLLITISCTGFTIPSLDAYLMNEFDFKPTTRRLPVSELGCSAGASALARSQDYLDGHPNHRVLILSVELCTLNFQANDPTRAQVISGALFGDGASAVILEGEQRVENEARPELRGYTNHFYQGTLDYMGYRNNERGVSILLSPKIPAHVKRRGVELIENFLGQWDLTASDVDHWIVHPGGRAIIDAVEAALDNNQTLNHSRRVLKKYGNLSSATVLFVLKSVLEASPSPGENGLIAAFGPGFNAELSWIEW